MRHNQNFRNKDKEPKKTKRQFKKPILNDPLPKTFTSEFDFLVHCDGSFSFGKIGIGICIISTALDAIIYEHSSFFKITKGSSHVAEYKAVFETLKWIDKHLLQAKILICSDSKSMIEQLQGLKGIGNGYYTELANAVQTLLSKSKNTVTFKWIPRKFNQVADTLSKQYS